MDFQSEVLQRILGELNPHEGACGICHLALMKISESGGKFFAYEAPDGSVSKVLDHNNEIIAKE